MLDHGTALAAVAVIGVAGVVARALAARLPIPLPIVLLAVGFGHAADLAPARRWLRHGHLLELADAAEGVPG